ncbi:MAG: tetratricopeptide repeat protein [Phycisphaerae bacterium]|nr:tetratricopeptide repeat protein [Phycisphaerae bacterium]
MIARRFLPAPTRMMVAGLLVLLSGTVSAHAQQPDGEEPPSAEQSSPQPEPLTDSAKLVQLNAGIAAYRAGSLDEARRILEGLVATDPNNTAGQYYLGLIFLKLGLSTTGNPDEARKLFESAQVRLRKVVEIADPAAFPFEAYLDLGIAQLGSQELTDEGMAISLRAAQTLQSYVDQEIGRDDRIGHFFLGVAYYRLSSQQRRLSGQNKSRDHRRAEAAFERAMILANRDLADGTFSQAEYADFETKIIYYRGLLAIFAQSNSEARGLLQNVVDRGAAGPKTKIIEFSEQLIRKIDDVMQSSPAPMTLDSPIGPLQIEGFVTVGNYYDTNVILLGQDTLLPRGIPHEEDYRFGLQTGVDVSRFLTKKRDNIIGESLFIGVGGSTSHFWQPHVKEFDLNIYGGRAYVNWEPVADLFVGMQYDYSYTKLGQEPFISSNRITPVVSKTWRRPGMSSNDANSELGRTDFFYTYDDRDYLDRIFDPRLDRDGNYHSVGFRQTFNLMQAKNIWRQYYADRGNGPRDFRDFERWMTFRFGYTYRNERTQGDEFDLWGNTVYGGIEIPLPRRLSFDFAAEYTWDEYTRPSLFDYRGFERSDFIQRYIFGLTYTLKDRGEVTTMESLSVKLRGSIELQYQDSSIWDRLSQDVYSFNRQIYGLELLISF